MTDSISDNLPELVQIPTPVVGDAAQPSQEIVSLTILGPLPLGLDSSIMLRSVREIHATPSGKPKIHRSLRGKYKKRKPRPKVKRKEKFAKEGKHEIQVRLAGSESAIIVEAAKEYGKRPGIFIRESALEAARKIIRTKKRNQ